ncbi:phosphatidylinositol-specific phospholipase C [Aspergillus puulaauensis]|uniref:Phosphatidylinositol-specific phospholipase C X domain-containing protein n=1 Tax=Aspergillus puulaauensis TaxID=1220207 RepID=A0A7R8APJ7_9EURO|nr:uncharacterized protein APUU_60237S [Aspergillus puulaauensis]BCS27189.1 hypothetical protein APUU_60237S [Aspergillus puulaauensis]
MVAENLIIRNLSSTPITLKRIERFRAPEKARDVDIGALAKNFTRLVTNVTRAEAPVTSIEENTKAFEHKDVDIHVEPFKTVRTDLRSFIDSDKERIRWVFESKGERHQIQTPVPTTETASMKPLSNDAKLRFTGIFSPAGSHLAVFSSANLNAWMRELKDDTLLSSLSIPGTHNSPTCHVAPPSVRCQAVDPREQLKNGVRFFDIRVQPKFPEDKSKDELALVHSTFPISLTGEKLFRDLEREVNDFLEHNPSETLIISLKREGPGNHTDQQLSRIVRDHYARDGSRWYTDPKIPTLGEARGKIVLVRRFDMLEELKGIHGGRGWGINATGWADNCDNAACPSGQLVVQDFYEVLEAQNIDKKVQYVTAHCKRAGETSYPFGVLPGPQATRAHPFYINFLSASNFFKLGTWPEKIAEKVNPATVDYLCRRHGEKEGADWGTGVLVTDWVGLDGDWDLVRAIVGLNAKLMTRQRNNENKDHKENHERK